MTNRLPIVDALESARKAQGLRQEDLAEKAGTSRVTVGRVEAGFDPKLSTFYELVRALGLELMVVPKGLANEVQSFIQSGGRMLAQPSGAGAPDSVVAHALAASTQAHRGMKDLNLQKNEFTASNLTRHLAERGGSQDNGVSSTEPTQGTTGKTVFVQTKIGQYRPGSGGMGVGKFPTKEGTTKGPGISPAALQRLHGAKLPKGSE